MTQPHIDEAVAYAIRQLEVHLPASLLYHNVWHSKVEVTTAVLHLAQAEKLPFKETRLLQVAAAFHDIGFTRSFEEHELAGVEIVREVLPQFGFAKTDITLVEGMILATRLPQSPTSLPEAILADADLDVLGREDFFERNAQLRAELAALGRPFPQIAWLQNQLNFVSSHRYFTQSAKKLRQQGKTQNIKALAAKLAACTNA